MPGISDLSDLATTLDTGSDSDADVFPPLRRQTVRNCRYSSWSPRFRRHTPKASVIKPLPVAFIDYLEADGVFVPAESSSYSTSDETVEFDADAKSVASDASDDSEEEDLDSKFSFPELDAQIRSILAKYDGAVFPKLNWSSPQVSLTCLNILNNLMNMQGRRLDERWAFLGMQIARRHLFAAQSIGLHRPRLVSCV